MTWALFLRRLPALASGFSLLVGSLVLVGWGLDLPWLKGLIPGMVTMKPNTAVGFLLASAALWLSIGTAPSPLRRTAGSIASVLLLLLGGLTLLEYLGGLDLGIDQLLFTEPAGEVGTLAPGRMAPASALSFLSFGLALWMTQRSRWCRFAPWLLFPVGLVGAFSLLAYGFGPFGSFGLGRYFILALHTALTFIVLSAGALALHPENAFMRVLVSDRLSSWILRRLIPAALLLPVLLGGISRWGVISRWVEPPVALAIQALFFALVLCLVIGWVALDLDRMDGERARLEAQHRHTAQELRATLDAMTDGVITVDDAGMVLHLNPAAARMTGWTDHTTAGMPLTDLLAHQDPRGGQAIERESLMPTESEDSGEPTRSFRFCNRKGEELSILLSQARIPSVDPTHVNHVLLLHDQTKQAQIERFFKLRLDLQEYAQDHSLKELLTRALDETTALVASPIGFYHFYDAATGDLTLQQWSTQTRQTYCTASGEDSHYPLAKAGVWADAVRLARPVVHNDYASLPEKRGLPGGHASLVRELVVPVMRAGEVVAILGVGNKERDYEDQDVDLVRLMADLTWTVIERKRAETQLRSSEAQYRKLHESLRDAYVQVNMAGFITESNEIYREMLGYSEAELALLTYSDLTPVSWHATEARIVEEEILPLGVSRVYEKEYRRKDGTVFPVELRTFLLRDAQGAPSDMWAIVRDITERKRVEAALNESEARLREVNQTLEGLFDAIPDVIGIQDRDHRVVRYNAAGYQLIGLPPEQVDGRHCYELLGRNLPCEICVTRGIFETGKTTHVERFIPELNRWFDGRAYPIRDEQGNVVRAIEHLRDITARKTYELELGAKNELLRLTGAMAKVGGWAFDARTLKGTWTEEVARIHDLDPSDPTSVEIGLSFYPQPDRARIEQAVAEALRSGTPYDLELELISAKGAHKWVRTIGQPVCDKQGLVQKVQGVFMDITERRNADRVLRESEERLELALEGSQLGYWDWHIPENQVLRNTQWGAMLGYAPDEIQDTVAHWEALQHPQDQGIAWKAIQEHLEGRTPRYRAEYRLRAKDGSYRWILDQAKVVQRDAEGRPVRMTGTHTDITEIKEVQERLRVAQQETRQLLELSDRSRLALLSLVEDVRASEEEIRHLNEGLEQRVAERTQELQASYRELEAFAYSVSHDLRAPLRHMDGFLSMLERHLGENVDAKGARYLQVARHAAIRMSQLIDGLLSFSRLGRAELRKLPLELQPLVASVVEDFKAECEGRVIHWDIGALPSVPADPILLRVVFENLLGNALKFTRGQTEARIAIHVENRSDTEIVLAIQDNGVGFDPAYTHKLFGVFQRLHREEEFEGTGIGLANVHRVITRHGGRIWAEGRPGEGATLRFTLPLDGRQP